MALTIGFTPDTTTYFTGDAPIVVSLSGTPSVGFNDYFWESNNGVFSSEFVSNPTFTPNNATKNTLVVGRRGLAFLTGIVTPTNFTTYGTNGRRKIAGSANSWDTTNSGTGLDGNDGFFRVIVQESTTEKAMGLTANSAYADPYLTGTNSFLLCWHMLANGTAVPRKQGVSLANPVFYKAGDEFRVAVSGTTSSFFINGAKVVSTTTPSGNLYGEANFKGIGSIFDAPFFTSLPSTNEAIKSLQVWGIFPEQPNYSYEISSDNNTLASLAEDGTATMRLKGGLKKTLALQFTGRPYHEYVTINNFWETHQKHEKFFYRDIDLEKVYLVRFDTGLRVQVEGPDIVTINITLREA
jgi:hypothetical protein